MTEPISVPAEPAKTPSQLAAEYFGALHAECETVSAQSLAEPQLSAVAASFAFVNELKAWCEVLESRREVELLKVAALEYEFALLALTQGHYRNAFKSLRLVLELTLQAVLLSSNELKLREWLENRVDTSWSAIIDEKEGVFSPRFAKGFFRHLEVHVKHYAGMAVLLYRECSESVHGNMPKHITLPPNLGFDVEVFGLWHGKANLLALVANFCLVLRYFEDLSSDDRRKLSSFVATRLGHIAEIKHELDELAAI